MPKIHLKSIMITFNIQILPSIMQIQVATNLKEGYYKQRNIVMSPYFLGFVHRKMSYLLKTILSDTRKTLWERQPCFFLLFFQINWKSLLILHKRKTAQSCICAQWCWSLYLYSAYSNDHPLYKQGKAITISLSKHCTNISEALLSTIWHLSSHQNHEKKPESKMFLLNFDIVTVH